MKPHHSTLSSVVVTFLLTIPFACAVGAVSGMIYSFWTEELRENYFGAPMDIQRTGHRMRVLKDGRAVVYTTLSQRTRLGSKWEDSYRSLDGQPIDDVNWNDLARDKSFQPRRNRPPFLWTEDPVSIRTRYRESSVYFIEDGSPAVTWQFVPAGGDDRRRFLRGQVGDSITGFVSRAGFSTDEPHGDDAFLNTTEFLGHGDVLGFRNAGEESITIADFTSRSVETVDVPRGARWGLMPLYGGTRVVTHDEIEVSVFNVDGSEQFRWTLPEDSAPYIELFAHPDGDLLALVDGKSDHESAGRTSRSSTKQLFVRLNPEGDVVESHEYLAEHSATDSPPPSGFVKTVDSFFRNTLPGLIAPIPLVAILVVTVLLPWVASQDVLELSYQQVLQSTWDEGPWSLWCILLSGLLSVVLYRRRQRRFELRTTVLWFLYLFLLGIPGYLAWRFHTDWPISSIATGRSEMPEPNGLEIFDDSVAIP